MHDLDVYWQTNVQKMMVMNGKKREWRAKMCIIWRPSEAGVFFEPKR